MPTISLRLTEEQHAELKKWAYGSQRSVQREIVFRLFTEPTATAKFDPLPIQADAQPRDVKARAVVVDPHFKPDFK